MVPEMENKTARHLIFAFMRNPISVVNFCAILVWAGVWYAGRENTLAKLSTDAQASTIRMEKIESKIAVGDVDDMIRTQRLETSINEVRSEQRAMQTDIKWLVRAFGGPNSGSPRSP